jgi:serine/threonine protein kinase
MNDKNKIFKGKLNEYQLKESLINGSYHCDNLVMIVKNKKRRQLREILNHDKETLKYICKYLNQIFNLLNNNNTSVYDPFLVIYDECFQISNSRLFIVSEYFEDGDLENKIKRMTKQERYFSEDKVFDYTYYLASAINYLHQRNIIHKDVQPKNIYLRRDKLKLGNFGFQTNPLKMIQMMNTKDAVCYIAPEVIKNSDFDKPADIWSVGCIFYEIYMLNGCYTVKDILSGDLASPTLNASPKMKTIFNS